MTTSFFGARGWSVSTPTRRLSDFASAVTSASSGAHFVGLPSSTHCSMFWAPVVLLTVKLPNSPFVVGDTSPVTNGRAVVVSIVTPAHEYSGMKNTYVIPGCSDAGTVSSLRIPANGTGIGLVHFTAFALVISLASEQLSSVMRPSSEVDSEISALSRPFLQVSSQTIGPPGFE